MQFLSHTLYAILFITTLSGPLAYSQQRILTPTPPQAEGPFYPGAEIFTRVNGDMANFYDPNGASANGEPIFISGTIKDTNGNPVAGAEIQLWQTDGLHVRYLVEQTDKPLDPNFKYAGKDITNAAGLYNFITVRPMEYEADADWVRPSHIHVKVFVKGQLRLTTQIYFSDEMDLINKDKIIQQLPPELQKLLIIQLERRFDRNHDMFLKGSFNITLK